MTAGYPSEEPIAGKPHDGICGGESQQWLSYPTQPNTSVIASTSPVKGDSTIAEPMVANPGQTLAVPRPSDAKPQAAQLDGAGFTVTYANLS